MASSASHRHHVVIRNLPASATESDMVAICEEIGPVLSFNFFSNENFRYGVCEFLDGETALSALRNLQDYHFMGCKLQISILQNVPRKIIRVRKPLPSSNINAGSVAHSSEQISIDECFGHNISATSKRQRLDGGSNSFVFQEHECKPRLLEDSPVEMSQQLIRQVDTNVLKQIAGLKPKQLRCLRPEEQQQVFELQQILSSMSLFT